MDFKIHWVHHCLFIARQFCVPMSVFTLEGDLREDGGMYSKRQVWRGK